MTGMSDVIRLRDAASGSTAAILAGFGFNCYSFQAVVDGQAIETLWAEPGFAPGGDPMRNGIPLVFPFAGRLSSFEQTFQGQRFTVRDTPILEGKPLHGLVIDRPWRVVEQTESRAVGTFRASTDEPTLLDQWPADFEITVAYEVMGMALIAEITITNPDTKPLPFGFGTHPYFRLPLGGVETPPGGDGPLPQVGGESERGRWPRGLEGERAACRVTVPAGAYWELSELVPTGRKLPASGQYDLRNSSTYGDISVDAVFTDLAVVNGEIRTEIEDPNSGRRLIQRFDPVFRHCTVYCPPHREAIAIEPWTAIPNPLALAEQGIETGLQVLAPGESFSTRIDVWVE
jgi:aldose 1-epimerase